VRWTTSHELGIAADGTHLHLPRQRRVRAPRSGDGATCLNTAGVLAPLGNASPKTAVDAAGHVYVSNGWASIPASDGACGRSAPTSRRTTSRSPLQRPNQGGPALGQNGELIVCDLTGVYAYGAPPPATIYCTAKVNSQGCTPAIASSGVPSASSASAFDITAANVLNNKNGLYFYGTSGALAAPFQGGFLCVQAPIQRTVVQPSGGNPPPSDCSGSYTFDFNAWIQGGTDPKPRRRRPGQRAVLVARSGEPEHDRALERDPFVIQP
jgi:hypothetical protein